MIQQKIRYKTYERVLETIGGVLMAVLIALVALRWPDLPEEIPAHFNIAGEIDRWGGKGELLVLPAVGLLLYALLTVLSFFPQIWNTPVRVTPENQESIYRSVLDSLLLGKAGLAAIFLYLSYSILSLKPLSGAFLPIVLAAFAALLIFSTIRASRGGKQSDNHAKK